MGNDRVGAVIVTYHPSGRLRANIASLRPQVDDLVIVDNGSGAETSTLLEEISSTYECRLIANKTNLGVATALNLGVAELMKTGCAFIALFDQDSCVTDCFIQSMLTTYAAPSCAKEHLRVGMVVPTYVDERSGAAMPLMKDSAGCVLASMTSGSFLPIGTFERCGLFDESLFIDYVDIEYCLRIAQDGFSIVQSPRARLLHSLGALKQHRFATRTFSATNHSAARRYYITRNRATLFARYLTTKPGWVARDLWAMLAETAKILLVENDRLRKLTYIGLGLVDASLRRTRYRVEL